MKLSLTVLILLSGIATSQTSYAQPLPSETEQSDEFTLNLENVAIRTLIEAVAQRLDKTLSLIHI